MKKFIAYIFLLQVILSPSLLRAADPEDLAGHWNGYSVYKTNTLYFTTDFHKDSVSFTAVFDSDEQMVFEIPLQNLKATRDSVFFDLNIAPETWKFSAYYYHNKVKGIVQKGNLIGDFQLERDDAPKIKYTRRDTTFTDESVTLAGTLYIPNGQGPFPAIIFMPGSGDESRTGSAYLAQHFSQMGYVILIYDKRGVNKSTGDWHTSSFTDLAHDCIAGIKLLQGVPLVENNKIGVYGHGESGAICPLVLNLYPWAAFTISAGSAGVPMIESFEYEAKNRLSKVLSSSQLEIALPLIKLQADYALTMDGWDKIEEADELYSGEKWYEDYVKPPPQDDWWYSYYNKIGNYNPVDFWKNVKQPVLLLKGEHDGVAPGYPTFQNIEEALKRSGCIQYKIVFFPNTDHEFHVIDRNNVFWYKSIPNFCETISDWLKKNNFVPDKNALKPLKKNNADEDEEDNDNE